MFMTGGSKPTMREIASFALSMAAFAVVVPLLMLAQYGVDKGWWRDFNIKL